MGNHYDDINNIFIYLINHVIVCHLNENINTYFKYIILN